jgi:hypothetical protein
MSPESFKRLEEVDQPDSRNAGYFAVNVLTGKSRKLDLEDYYRAIAPISMGSSVPEHIRDSFTTAKHLALYSWYVYRFHTASQLQAYTTLEYALRERLGHAETQRRGLRRLLSMAIEQGLVGQQLIRDWPGGSHENEAVPEGSTDDWLSKQRWSDDLRQELR